MIRKGSKYFQKILIRNIHDLKYLILSYGIKALLKKDLWKI